MDSNRHHLYFTIAVVAILATGGFVMLEISDTMTDLALIEGSFYGVVRNGEARLSAEINRGIEGVDLNDLDMELEEIDSEINSL